jgi:hypothetical protein
MAKKHEPEESTTPDLDRAEADAERRQEAYEEAQAEKSAAEKKADKETEKDVASLEIKKGDRLYGGLVVHEVVGMHVTVAIPKGFVLRNTELHPIQQIHPVAAPAPVDPRTGELVDEGKHMGGREPQPGQEPAEFGTISMAQATTLKVRLREAEAGVPDAKQVATTGTTGGSSKK